MVLGICSVFGTWTLRVSVGVLVPAIVWVVGSPGGSGFGCRAQGMQG